LHEFEAKDEDLTWNFHFAFPATTVHRQLPLLLGSRTHGDSAHNQPAPHNFSVLLLLSFLDDEATELIAYRR
jgi:hypothetical protein